MVSPRVTIIVPTFNEATNVFPLAQRLRLAFMGIPAVVLFVDDSTDDTPTVVGIVSTQLSDDDFRIQLIHRSCAEQLGGLSGAVITGLREAAGSPIVVVMDGDLQHPPEDARRLYDEVVASGSDVVVATRYDDNGGADGLSHFRLAISRVSGSAAKLLFPRRLRGISDPMSGFFALRCEAISVGYLRPLGFKILLEILVRHSHLSTQEVSYHFAKRTSGASKGTVRQGVTYLHHLLSLRLTAI